GNRLLPGAGDAELAGGHRGRGQVEYERRVTAGRRRERARIGGELRLAAEGGHHRHVGRVGRGQAEHAVLERHHGVVGGGAEVPRVAHGDDADAERARLVDGQPHGQRGDVVAEALGAVVERRGG